MSSRRENVRKAVGFRHPAYAPLLYFNGEREKSDIIITEVVKHFEGEGEDISEWGFVWEKHDDTMGQPKEHPLEDWALFPRYRPPTPQRPDRFLESRNIRSGFGEDRYYVASLALSGFTVMTFLRGFSRTLEELYIEPERSRKLADLVFGFENEVIRLSSEEEFDAVAFFDDWGTQENLIISPEMWRREFKPRYREQFRLVHSLGMDVYFHSCGYIYGIIPDLIEIGVDILNISQPNLYDIEKLGQDFAGEVCFLCPVSYQTTSLFGTRDDIFQDVEMMIRNLCTTSGGFIGYVEEYGSIGLSDRNYTFCVDAFTELGRNYKKIAKRINDEKNFPARS